VDRRNNLSLEEFIEQYEIPNKPVVITDVINKWPSASLWNREYLILNYGDVIFKTDQGVSLKLRDYFQYCGLIKEASPMYLFDNSFGEKIPQMLQDYQIPHYFEEDLFNVLGIDHRPSFRWILVGPQRSGASFHKDPNATSAWNALLSGRKKWILYPPDIVPPGVHPSPDGWEVATPESVVEWFVDFYDQVQKSAVKPFECVTKPGELLFIPSGWWHTALNLEESIAVTQNFVSSQNLLKVNNFLKSKKKQELYKQFNLKLSENYPGLLQKVEMKEKEWEQTKKKKTMWETLMEAGGDEDVKFSLF